MSSKTSRKSKNPKAKAPEPIITRTKSAQQRRQLRNKEEKKTEKPELTKPDTKSPRSEIIKLSKPETKSPRQETKSPRQETKSPRQETKSTKTDKKSPKPDTKTPKPNKTVKRSQVSLLKPISVPNKVLEQIEYYPNTLKRKFRAKKVMLKPKDNFKVIATTTTTNKRKMSTPQKGQSQPSKNPLSPEVLKNSTRPCSPELSMQDMVRMMEETRSLSDEDFMEILTCPSPVWWEDPPDRGIDEGKIRKRKFESPKNITKETKKRKISSNKKSKSKKKQIIINLDDEPEPPKEIVKENIPDEKFVKKKQKLENILSIIKSKGLQPKKNEDKIIRKISESEGDFSDLSYNEEEILKSLENMDIPIEESLTASTSVSLDKTVAPKNDNVEREASSTCIPIIKEVFSLKSSALGSSDFKSDVSLNEMNIQSDTQSDEINFSDRCTNSSLDKSSIIDLVDNNSNSEMRTKSPVENNSNVDDIKKSDATKNDDVPAKKIKVLSEYINVYKITPEKQSEDSLDINSKQANNTGMTKLEAVRGKLNDFFKHCKSNKRLKKTEKVIPTNPVTDVKEAPIDNKKENGDSKIDLDDEKSRLSCDYCVQKTENGTKDFSCEKCEMAPILPCGLCNFLADTKEVYRKHVSSCKDVARINWSHSYVLNQT